MACSWRSPGTEVNSNWECRVEGEQGWWSCCSLKQVAFLRVSCESERRRCVMRFWRR